MINIKFYQDKEGYFKAETDSKYLLLGKYFESEVQGIATVCQDLLDSINEIEIGDRLQLQGVGNGYGLKLTAKTANIWSEFTKEELTLEVSLAEFKQVLEDCLKFCKTVKPK